MGTERDMTLTAFIEEWEETPTRSKEIFLHFKAYLDTKDGVTMEFIPRLGVTYSLRAVHVGQEKRELFVMIDVIEDEPRWLSICFFGDMVTDPEEKGDFVPGGLYSEDAVCFDIEEWDNELIRYVGMCIDQAYLNAPE